MNITDMIPDAYFISKALSIHYIKFIALQTGKSEEEIKKEINEIIAKLKSELLNDVDNHSNLL